MAKEKVISIREYARRRECSDVAVHKAYKEGHLPDSVFAWNEKKTRKKGIYPKKADEAWAKTIDVSKAKNEKLTENILNAASGKGEEIEVPKDGKGPSRADAQRIESIFKAKLTELKYKREVGDLVERKKVYDGLYAAGQEIRDSMLSIPDRIIDEVLAAKNRNEAHEVLRKAIHSELERLSNIESRKFG